MVLTNKNKRSILISITNKKTYPYHTNGDGTPLIRTGLLAHTNSMPKRPEFEARNCTCIYCTYLILLSQVKSSNSANNS